MSSIQSEPLLLLLLLLVNLVVTLEGCLRDGVVSELTSDMDVSGSVLAIGTPVPEYRNGYLTSSGAEKGRVAKCGTDHITL